MLMQVKKITFVPFFAVTVLALIFTGCSKSNDGGGPSGTTFTATVGANAFAAGSIPGEIQATYTSGQQLFTVGGIMIKTGDTATMAVTFPLESKTGIQISSDTANVGVIYTPDFGKTIYETDLGFGHAVVTVTTQDTQNKKVAGTFTGVVYNMVNSKDSIAITNGKFSSAYTLQ